MKNMHGHELLKRLKWLSREDQIGELMVVIGYIADMEDQYQKRLVRHWFYWITEEKRNKALAVSLLQEAGKLIYPPAQMENWAETRLANMNMDIIPLQMAYEYALATGRSPDMAGIYVRDMQRIKARVARRIKKAKKACDGVAPSRKKVMVTRPRLRRTTRQDKKYKQKRSVAADSTPLISNTEKQY